LQAANTGKASLVDAQLASQGLAGQGDIVSALSGIQKDVDRKDNGKEMGGFVHIDPETGRTTIVLVQGSETTYPLAQHRAGLLDLLPASGMVMGIHFHPMWYPNGDSQELNTNNIAPSPADLTVMERQKFEVGKRGSGYGGELIVATPTTDTTSLSILQIYSYSDSSAFGPLQQASRLENDTLATWLFRESRLVLERSTVRHP
jgi:hypothetical protein